MKDCKICGNPFIPNCNNQSYCSKACKHKAAQIRCIENRKKLEMMQKKRNSITDVAVEAKKSGMTYGQYVARMGL